MKKYLILVLGGVVHLALVQTAPAEEPIRIPVADQTLGNSGPFDSRGQTDQRPGHFADDQGSDPLLNGHFVAGVGVYIMKPFFQSNPAFFTQTASSTSGMGTFSSSFTTIQHDFDWGMDAAPVIWLGYTSDCGLGVRARWWLFDQKSITSAVRDPNTTIISAVPTGLFIESPQTPFSPPQSIVSSPMLLKSNLKLNVWDFEATGETYVGRWALLFSGGFRYAHLSQDYDASQTSTHSIFLGAIFPAGVSHQVDFLSSGHNFNGAGPTLALEARRPLGNSGLSLYGNFRGALLFGQSKQQVNELAVTHELLSGATTITSLTNQSNHDTVIPVAELEMGAEFSRNWGAVQPFVRTGLVAQTWFDAGSASTLDGNLGFLGLSVTAGLNY